MQINVGEPENFQAALIESDLGQNIFLFKKEKDNSWWTRFYEVPEK